jgi:hypothetical protein
VRIIVEDLLAGQGKTYAVPVRVKSDKRVFARLIGEINTAAGLSEDLSMCRPRVAGIDFERDR